MTLNCSIQKLDVIKDIYILGKLYRGIGNLTLSKISLVILSNIDRID